MQNPSIFTIDQFNWTHDWWFPSWLSVCYSKQWWMIGFQVNCSLWWQTKIRYHQARRHSRIVMTLYSRMWLRGMVFLFCSRICIQHGIWSKYLNWFALFPIKIQPKLVFENTSVHILYGPVMARVGSVPQRNPPSRIDRIFQPESNTNVISVSMFDESLYYS